MLVTIHNDEGGILRKSCENVKDFGKPLKKIVSNMFEEMRKGNGIGLAAPQIGINKNIIVTNWGDILINPILVFKSDKMNEFVEGCLSLPGNQFKIKRHIDIKVRYLDVSRVLQIVSYKDIEAIVIQHEIDHLHGILISDKKI